MNKIIPALIMIVLIAPGLAVMATAGSSSNQLTQPQVDIFPTPGIRKYAAMGPKDIEICEWIARETINRTKCEIDEPVTTENGF